MITVYGSSNCLHCLKIKQLCESFDLKHEYINIDTPEGKQRFSENFPAIFHVPITVWNDEVFEGYQKFAEALENNIQNYGEGKI